MKIEVVKDILIDLFPIEILKDDMSILLLGIKKENKGQMIYEYYVVDKKNRLPYNENTNVVKKTLDDFVVNFFIKDSNSW